jgi:RNA polymerase sigma-70 factor, ECF subfamily
MDSMANEAAWRRWVEQHTPKLLLFARQRARNEADAEDLVQEATAEAAARQDNGAPPPVRLVLATIHRRAIDAARAEDRRVLREQTAFGQADEAQWFDTGVENREFGQIVVQALDRIPGIYRDAVTLRIWGELTFAEIGETLGIPANTAASRYRYGLAELRRLTRGVLT